MLTKYNGAAITYDEIENPLSYYNGWNMTWTDGRKLESIDFGDGATSTFKYNENGNRISKTRVGEETRYVLNGSSIVCEVKSDGSKLYYFYDEAGSAVGFEYYDSASDTQPDTYYYVKNLQGDVIKLIDKDGETVVNYSYNIWGVVTVVSDTSTNNLASVNPILYRSYYYDWEMGFYYLNSRYYDPETGRFINADDTDILAFEQGTPLQYNLFSYCHNNPVNMADFNGYIPFFVITGIIGAVAGGIIGYVATGSWKGALAGAAIGGVIGLTGGAVAGKLLAGSAIAKTSAVIAGGKALFVSAGTVVVSSWQQAEQLLRKAYHGVSKAINTPYGRRIVDSLSGRFARESKYGYQGLSTFIKQEILKDLYLISKGYIVEWHFYWSQVSNSGGPSGPLRRALQQAGIKIVEHFRR